MVSGAARAWRNGAAGFTTAVTLGLLFWYPTSTAGGPRRESPAGADSAVLLLPGPSGVLEPVTDDGHGHGPGELAGAEEHPAFFGVNGPAIPTVYGPVQVQIHVLSGEIITARALVYPQASLTDKAINHAAIPILEDATADNQGADVDTVSGATQTSEGYRQSLQAALDAANL